MSDPIAPDEPSKYERRVERRREREDESAQQARRRRIKRILKIVAGIAVAALVVWAFGRFGMRRSSSSAGAVIARSGIHWHPELTIFIKGTPQVIPQHVGLGMREETVHTHEDLPKLHLEVPGVVTKDDIRLGRFFKVWGKRFDRNCIFEFCNGPEGTVKMYVNGKENFNFENYEMHDFDKIEIRYE